MTATDSISKKRLLINTVSSVVTRVLNLAVMVWVIQHLLRRLTPEEYSIYPVVMAVMAMVPIFTSLFRWGLGRYATEAFAQGDQGRLTEICSSIFAILVPVAVVFGLGAALVIRFVDSIVTIEAARLAEAQLMLALLMGHAIVNLLLSPFSVGMFVRERFVVLNVIDLATTCLRIMLLAVFLLGIGPQVIWVVVAQVVTNLVADLAKFFGSKSLLPAMRFRRSSVRMDVAKEIMAFNAWAVVNQTTGFIRDAADPLILKNLATDVDVNTMYLGPIADKQLRSFVLTAFAPVLPVLTTMHATNQHARIQNSFVRGGRLCVWMLMSVTMPLIIFRNEVMQLYLGPQFDIYSESGVVLALLLCTFFFIYPRIMLTKIGAAVARVRAIGLCNLGSQFSNLGLTLYLVGVLKMGAVGAALSTLVCEAVWHVFVWWPLSIWFVRIPTRRFIVEVLILGFLPSLACGVGSEVLRRWITPQGILSLLACTTLGFIVYVAVIFLFCLTPADKRDLGRLKEFAVVHISGLRRRTQS